MSYERGGHSYGESVQRGFSDIDGAFKCDNSDYNGVYLSGACINGVGGHISWRIFLVASPGLITLSRTCMEYAHLVTTTFLTVIL